MSLEKKPIFFLTIYKYYDYLNNMNRSLRSIIQQSSGPLLKQKARARFIRHACIKFWGIFTSGAVEIANLLNSYF